LQIPQKSIGKKKNCGVQVLVFFLCTKSTQGWRHRTLMLKEENEILCLEKEPDEQYTEYVFDERCFSNVRVISSSTSFRRKKATATLQSKAFYAVMPSA
jgi:hypothetical protein